MYLMNVSTAVLFWPPLKKLRAAKMGTFSFILTVWKRQGPEATSTQGHSCRLSFIADKDWSPLSNTAFSTLWAQGYPWAGKIEKKEASRVVLLSASCLGEYLVTHQGSLSQDGTEKRRPHFTLAVICKETSPLKVKDLYKAIIFLKE